MPDEKDGDWNVPEAELPTRRPASTAQQEMLAARYAVTGQSACPSCGRQVTALQSPYNSTHVLCNGDGSLHVGCRAEREPVVEPLPPVATYEQQQEKLDRLLGKK